MMTTRYTRRSPALSPWLELEDMSGRLNRLFSSPGRDEAPGRSAWSPPVNVEETEEELRLTAELPGMKIDDIEIEVENKTLTLRGEKKAEEELEDRKFHLREQRFGSFQRRFTLPRTVRTEEITAHFRDGILHVQMPKEAEAKARKITIKGES